MTMFENYLKEEIHGHTTTHAAPRTGKECKDISSRCGCIVASTLGIRMVLSPFALLLSILLMLLNSLEAQATFSGELKSMPSSCHLLC